MSANSTFLYPNVTSLPGAGGIQPGSENRAPVKKQGPGEFDQAIEKAMGSETATPKLDLNQVKQPLKFSAHASQRLKDRNIALDQNLVTKLNAAVDKAEAKGLEDTLVLTENAAFIVSVKNRTIVTALDKGSLSGNVFTNIDGAVIA